MLFSIEVDLGLRKSFVPASVESHPSAQNALGWGTRTCIPPFENRKRWAASLDLNPHTLLTSLQLLRRRLRLAIRDGLAASLLRKC
jgi:hypothetical protein